MVGHALARKVVKRDGVAIAAAGGLHGFTGWDGAFITDSGGFQVFSLAHGGKDRHPYPVPLKVYDETIRMLKSAVLKAKLGREEEVQALKRLDDQARRLERSAEGPSPDQAETTWADRRGWKSRPRANKDSSSARRAWARSCSGVTRRIGMPRTTRAAGRVPLRLLRRHRGPANRELEAARRGDVLVITPPAAAPELAPDAARVEVTGDTRVERITPAGS